MKRYAQLLYGRVIEIREAESLAQLATVFGPENYWIDVTGMDCEKGYVSKFVDGAGVIYVDPIKEAEKFNPTNIEGARNVKLAALRAIFAKERDKIRFITLREAVMDGEEVIEPEVRYGFDCESEDITNFLAAFLPLLVAKEGTASYKVWTDEYTKEIVELTYEDMLKVYTEVRTSQLEAYAKYETLKAQVMSCKTKEAVQQITWDEENEDQENDETQDVTDENEKPSEIESTEVSDGDNSEENTDNDVAGGN